MNLKVLKRTFAEITKSIGLETKFGAFALPWFISIPLFVLFGCAASSMAGSKYDEYFR